MAKQTSEAQTDQRREQTDQKRQPQQNDTRIAPRGSTGITSPFTLMQRFFSDDVTRLLDEFAGRPRGDNAAWVPKVDVRQRDNELVVHADLPGVDPDDVTVEINDDAITISGERQEQREDDRGDVRRIERSYGAFFREIPLPEGAIVDQAKASYRDGVLEITIPAPPEQVTRGRRLEISRDDGEDKTRKTEKEQSGRSS